MVSRWCDHIHQDITDRRMRVFAQTGRQKKRYRGLDDGCALQRLRFHVVCPSNPRQHIPEQCIFNIVYSMLGFLISARQASIHPSICHMPIACFYIGKIYLLVYRPLMKTRRHNPHIWKIREDINSSWLLCKRIVERRNAERMLDRMRNHWQQHAVESNAKTMAQETRTRFPASSFGMKDSAWLLPLYMYTRGHPYPSLYASRVEAACCCCCLRIWSVLSDERTHIWHAHTWCCIPLAPYIIICVKHKCVMHITNISTSTTQQQQQQQK